MLSLIFAAAINNLEACKSTKPDAPTTPVTHHDVLKELQRKLKALPVVPAGR